MITALTIFIGSTRHYCARKRRVRLDGLRYGKPSRHSVGAVYLSVYDRDQNRRIGTNDVAMVERRRGSRARFDAGKRWFKLGPRLAKQLDRQRRKRRMRTACVGLIEADGLTGINSDKQLGRYLMMRRTSSGALDTAEIDEAMYAQGKTLCSKGKSYHARRCHDV